MMANQADPIGSEQRFREQLLALHEVGHELLRAHSVETLCRTAVELGRTRLGFARLGIWFSDDEGRVAVGSYGIDEEGRLRDERGRRLHVAPGSEMGRVFLGQRRVLVVDDTPLLNDRAEPVGRGTHLIAAIWDGERVIGAISADDLLEHGSVAARHPEVLALFAASVGHVYSRERAEEERQSLQSQVREAQKMEAVGRLAGGVAHDFNNLLTPLMAFSDLLVRGLRPEDPLRAYAEEISKITDQAAALTRQLLAFGRRQTSAPKPLDLNAVVANVEKMLRRLIGEDVFLATALDPDLGLVLADPGQMEQLLINLVVNARDAIQPGGMIAIETSRMMATEEMVRAHRGCKPGPRVVLTVSDDGCGIAEEDIPHIFEPFYTTKTEGRGTGLGLSIVYGIVNQHGGCIHVESSPGSGAAFRVYLPAVEPSTEAHAAAPEETQPLRGSEHILLVEDDVMVRASVRAMLVSYGYRVTAAESGRAALDMVAQGTAFDLVLTDVIMPEMGGPEVVERALALRPGLRVLFMSGYTGEAARPGGPLTNAPLIQKPFTPKAIAARVREVLDARPPAR